MNLYLNIKDFKPLVTQGSETGIEKEIGQYNKPLSILNNNNIRFLYAKQNTIMDGKFTKLLYSDDYVIMNGFYFVFPILCDTWSHNNNSNFRYIQSNKQTNIELIEDFAQLESKILTHYKNYNNCDKNKELSLHKQLLSKQIRVYKENANKPLDGLRPDIKSSSIYTIKISGVWESFDKIGITYKIIEIRGT